MKRALIVLPLLAIMAGVASAQMLQPPVAANAPARAKAELPPSPQPEAVPARISRTVIARQAPVPMPMTSRPPAPAPVTAGAAAATAKPPIRQFSETDARTAIEADGYKKVRIVSKGADGTWQARAFRGATEVAVRVDAQGHVTGD
jgi:hypothetical protein